MEDNNLKRRRESSGGDAADNKSTKRRQKLRHRKLDGDELKLIKLYEDLAADSDDVRLEAAKEIIVRFSPENEPSPEAVEKALHRIIRGLCSQRKSARVGFCVTLTELLRQLFGSKERRVQGLSLGLNDIIALVEEKTKVEGNVPGQERRDHLIGKLFGCKAIMQSLIIIEPELSLECWNTVLDHIYGMARDVPWLREECGLILVEAVKSLKADSDSLKCAEEIIQRLQAFKLTNTPEGVAIWLVARNRFESILPKHVWHDKDPMSKKERTRLAKILKEDFRNTSQDGKDENIKSAGANPNPIFAWELVLSESLQRDGGLDKSQDIKKADFPQFWIDTVDSNLLSSSSSHERKLWGIKLFTTSITSIPDWALGALFSPNLLRTLINQSKKGDRFLHAAALTALKAIQQRVQQQPSSALTVLVAITDKHGAIDFDKITQTKTIEQILLSTDDKTLRKCIRHLQSLLLRPDTQDSVIASSRRQTVADILLNVVKQYKHYAESSVSKEAEVDNWLRNVLETLVEHAYFVPTEKAKTSKVPLPPFSNSSRKMFSERLASCLTRLLTLDDDSRAIFATMVIGIIRNKATSSKTSKLVFKADASVMATIEKAFQSLDAISDQRTNSDKKSTADGFILLYSVALLQVFDGDGDAVLLLEDLESARESLSKVKASSSQDQNVFVEIILTFLGNPRALFRNIAQDAFATFASDITSDGLRSLTELLDTAENEDGQKELFEQGGSEDHDSHADEDDEETSDVEMIDGEPEASASGDLDESDEESTGDSESEDAESAADDESGNENDEELAAFDNLLAQTLQTSRLPLNNDNEEGSSDDSDMDDDQMMALDPHLAKIFKERSNITSKKKQRKDAKQTVLQFKSRVLDLLAIYLDKQYSNTLALEVLVPLLRRIRAGANNPLTKKIDTVLKAYTVTRKNRKSPLPKPNNAEPIWEILSAIHEEMKLGGSSLHATACSNASLHIVKILVGLDKANYSKAVDIYSEMQKAWFIDKRSKIHAVLFTTFQTWSISVKNGGKY